MTLKEYKDSKKNNKVFIKLKNLFTRVIVCSSIVLSILIMCNLSSETKEKVREELFNTNINFSFFNKMYSKLFIKNNDVMPVSGNEDIYSDYENYYEGISINVKDENVKTIQSGIVVYIGEKDNYKKTIILQQSDGTDAWYGNIEDVNINLYDYVPKGTNIATVKDKLYLVFEKNGEFLDYKKYIG